MRIHWSVIAMGLAVCLTASTPGWPSDFSDLEQTARALDLATTNAGSPRVAGRLAAELNDSWGRTPAPYSAESLATQRAETGWGWGGVLIGNRLAQHIAESRLAANPTLAPAAALAQSLAAVTAARQAHSGWGVIAQENGVKLGALVRSVKHSTESVAAGLRSTDKPASKGQGGALGPHTGSPKPDKARAGATEFANSFDTGHQRGGSAAVSGPGVAGGAGHGGSSHGTDKGGGPSDHTGGGGLGGGNADGGGNGGGGGGGKGK